MSCFIARFLFCFKSCSVHFAELLGDQLDGGLCARYSNSIWFKVIVLLPGVDTPRRLSSFACLSGPPCQSPLSHLCHASCPFTRMKVLLNSPITQQGDKEAHRVVMVRSREAVPTAFTLSAELAFLLPKLSGTSNFVLQTKVPSLKSGHIFKNWSNRNPSIKGH